MRTQVPNSFDRNLQRVAAFLLLATGLAGCSGNVVETGKSEAQEGRHIALLDVSHMPTDSWRHLKIKGHTDYRIVEMDGRLAIRARGAGGASGLIRRTAFSPQQCETLSWTWRVNQLQPSADLAKKRGDDVAAAIFVMFGDPGLLSAPDPVSTLRYVWTVARHRVDEIVANPYMPDMVQNVVVHAGNADVGQWVTEQRNIRADYQRAFGKAPTDEVEAIALFVDNDQTKEPVEAYFQRIDVSCS
ncbi:MAG: DUF3047 domain-containing protein [Alphaproteobacteria bacterium]|nr:DUF3047 domain-containing protein [Alphaproteobacteria bacterium]